MKPIHLFYDDIYLYQEFSQPVEGQTAPVLFKIATGPKPGYEHLAAHIEEVYQKAFQTKQGADPSAAPATMFAAAPGTGLPTDYYAEHTLFISKQGTVWHLEYHFYPKPTLYLYVEPFKVGRREKSLITKAILYDQSYLLDGQEYIVTSLRGNYADFTEYSPFFLEKDQEDIITFSQDSLLKSAASFKKADRGKGTHINAETWFREQLLPRIFLNLLSWY
ncbi:MAG: hypothetical protein ACOX6B_10545 [Thermoguttaceae bacterium]